MYVPEKRIIRHGLANVKFTAPEGSHYADAAGDVYRHLKEKREKEYKETNDLYDLQAKQANEFDSALQGTQGKDYESLQTSIVGYRDEIKELYKGKTLKETKTPEFQRKLYDIRQGLATQKNVINTFHGQVKEANDQAKNSRSINQKEWSGFINTQMQLPPEQREKDLVKKLNTDPLFFSSNDYTASILESEKTMDEQFERETKDLILNYDGTYRPSLGQYKNGEFIYNPSDELVDKLLKGDKRFSNQMIGMLPPEAAEEMIGAGMTRSVNQAVRNVTKEYIIAIAKQGYGAPNEKPVGKTVKTWNYYRPTTAEDKDNKENQEINVIQQRLNNADPSTFNDYKGELWKKFNLHYNDETGEVIGVEATREVEDEWVKGLKRPKVEFFPVDPKDAGSVKSVINQIKHYKTTDTKSVTPKETNVKTTFTIKGTKYTRQQLLDMRWGKGERYSPKEIDEMIKDGRLKPN